MPITKSAKKALRVSQRKTAQNLKRKKNLKKVLKKANSKNLSNIFSKVDKAAKRKTISANKAARIKASLTKKFGVPKGKKTVKETPVAKPAKSTKIIKVVKSSKTGKNPKKLIKKGSKI